MNEYKVTGIYTNWKRKDQLLKILNSAKAQTVPIRLWLIDNSKDTPDELKVNFVKRFPHDNSLMCWERWRYAQIVNTPYVFIMDDDLIFATSTEIKKCIDWMEKHPEFDAIGYTGVKLDLNKGYFKSQHYINVKNLTEVDIIKGRFMFIRTSSLKNLDSEPDLTCDDIKVSSHLKNKALIPLSFTNLKQGKESVYLQKGQGEKREKATKKYFA